MRVRGGDVCGSWWRLATYLAWNCGGWDGLWIAWWFRVVVSRKLQYSVFVVELGGWPDGWRLVMGLERALRRLCTGQGVAVVASGRRLAAAACDLNTKRLQ